MLKSLKLKNFIVFEQAEFEFCKGLNVIIGENGTGKTQLLKLAYAMFYVWHEEEHEEDKNRKPDWESRLDRKLRDVFRIEYLNRLCKHNASENTEIMVSSFLMDKPVEFMLYKTVRTEMKYSGIKQHSRQRPVFIPAKEVLSIYPNFISLYEKYHISFDETYYDLCKTLTNPLLKNLDKHAPLLETLENIIGGKVIFTGNSFYIRSGKEDELQDMEINLAAEGIRKIAMLAYLIANDSLKPGNTLFWDEPETNLNPKLMRTIAVALAHLANHGVQVMVTTHNLFLMKELDLQSKLAKLAKLAKNQKAPRFFSLVKQDKQVIVEQGEKLTDLATIVTLDEEMALYDREQEAYYAARG